jgi:hypothetical protein
MPIMGLVTRLHCPACAYHKLVLDGVLLVTRDDGVDEICPHPMEIRHAEGVTGRSVADLKKAGRLHGAAGTFCRTCGEVGYYRAGVASRCAACGPGTLEPIHHRSEMSGGCSTMGLLINAAMLPPLLTSQIAWSLPGLFLIVVVGLRWGVREASAKHAFAAIPCPKCHRPGLKRSYAGKT